MSISQKLRQFFRRKMIEPILSQLWQGANPEKLAWSVSLGGALGLFPILGSTTTLCFAAGAIFRLNHVAMQAVNYLVYGLHLALIPVFIRLGEKISGASPILIDLAVMKNQFQSDPTEFLKTFGLAAWHGILAWGVFAPIPTWLTAEILKRVFKNLMHSKSR
ncbi:MAG: DUF2062 domain-containing protein [Bdellovibrionales bacterium]|nr:DUF2062 domain-containing protein [Bdellovibrionales bacterium]